MPKKNDRELLSDDNLKLLIQVHMVVREHSEISTDGEPLSPKELVERINNRYPNDHKKIIYSDIESVVRRDMARHRQIYLPQVLNHRQGGVRGTTPVEDTSIIRRKFLDEFLEYANKVRAGRMTEQEAWYSFMPRIFSEYINHENLETLLFCTLDYAGFRIQDTTLITQGGLEGFAYRYSDDHVGWYGIEVKCWSKKIGAGKNTNSTDSFVRKLIAHKEAKTRGMNVVGGVFLSKSGYTESALKAEIYAKTKGLDLQLWTPKDLIEIWIDSGCMSFKERDSGFLLWCVCNRSGAMTRMK